MNIFTAIFLGAIQGLTEFLPISSSGHLSLANSLLNIPQDNLFFEVVLHLGTLFAVIIFMRKKIALLLFGAYRELSNKEKTEKTNLRYIGYIIAGIMPAVIFALFFNDMIENAFSNMRFIGIFFLITAALLFSTKFFSGRKELNLKKSLIVGTAQIFALFPGISRSGTTISAGIISGLDRERACDFSFFMAMPLIFAAFAKEMMDSHAKFDINVLTGFLSSFIFGYISVFFLYKILKSDKFYYFSYYLAIIGVFTIIRSVV